MRRVRSKVASAALGLWVLCSPGGSFAQQGGEQDAGYVGDAVCAACHPGLLEDYAKTIHAKAFPQTAERFQAGHARVDLMSRGCEGCHGPASAHVAAGGGKASGGMLHLRADGTESAQQQSELCLQCHEGGAQTYWHLSAHDVEEVSCSSCHTVMKAVSHESQLSRKTQTETCSQCHLIPRSQMYRNAHMPLRPTEDKMDCGSCHNPHGTIAEKLIADHTVNDLCYQCHAEKRGPFLWEHAPVHESCLGCHDPHGTTRTSMLNLDLPRLCQLCHVGGHPGGARMPDDRFVIGSSCLQCHPNIHGSNHPSGQRFVR